jgi:hypothetical protein
MKAGGDIMDKTATNAAPMMSNADYEAQAAHYLEETQKLLDRMQERRPRIERMQAETKEMLTQINTTLDRLAAA